MVTVVPAATGANPASRRAPTTIVVLTLAAGVLAGRPLLAQRPDSTPASVLRPRTAAEDLQLFSQVLNQLRVNHPDTLDTHELFMAAIEGMVRAADPHSYVLPAARLSPERQKALEDGKLCPVPIAFGYIGGAPVVLSVAPGSSASRLDILPGDELVAVEDRPARARSAGELEIALAGAKGSVVSLVFERRRSDGSLVTLRRSVKRERVEEGTAVPAAFALAGRVGYMRITTFEGARVEQDVKAALDRLEERGMTGLVLDLRDNPGGRVSQAAAIAGLFLPAGALVYTIEGRKQDVAEKAQVKRFWGSERRYPIVALVNAGTASAAELLAGALQDHDRALLYGRPSFGKALVMRGVPLTDGSIAVIVIGRLRTPCGRLIQREYHGLTTREYYRQARTDRDTAGRPTCRTDAGRVVRGGAGIVPDVLAPEPEPVPLWLARAAEEDLFLRWTGGWVSGQAVDLQSIDFATAPRLPAGATADFRSFAAAQGVTVPQDTAAERTLTHVLLRWVAQVRSGDPGWYRAAVEGDGDVEAARALVERAERLLKGAGG